MSDDLLDIADELYGLSMNDFTPARDAKAKELKGTELAAPVKALKKPTMAAWVVNMLVRHETEQVDQVLAVGAALRDAAESLDGKELRELTKQRRQLTSAVTTRARGVATTLGVKVTQAVADQVEGSLTAAMLDPDCAKALRSGLLVAPLSATGVGESAAGAAVAVPEALGFTATSAPAAPDVPAGRPDLKVVPDPDADAKKLATAEAALEAASSAEEAARATYEETDGAVTELEARSLQLQGEIEEHQRAIAQLEETSEEVEEELDDAEEARTEARTALRKAEQAREQAESAVERLRGKTLATAAGRPVCLRAAGGGSAPPGGRPRPPAAGRGAPAGPGRPTTRVRPVRGAPGRSPGTSARRARRRATTTPTRRPAGWSARRRRGPGTATLRCPPARHERASGPRSCRSRSPRRRPAAAFMSPNGQGFSGRAATGWQRGGSCTSTARKSWKLAGQQRRAHAVVAVQGALAVVVADHDGGGGVASQVVEEVALRDEVAVLDVRGQPVVVGLDHGEEVLLHIGQRQGPAHDQVVGLAGDGPEVRVHVEAVRRLEPR